MVYQNEKVQGGTMTWKIINDDNIIATDLSAEELAHNNLYSELDDAIANAVDELEPPHVIHVGLDYFVGLACKLAPTPEEADILIDSTIERAKNEYK